MSERDAAGLGALLRLGATLALGRASRPQSFDAGRAVCRWARALLAAGDGEAAPVRVGKRSFVIVGPGARSRAILDGAPDAGGLPPGNLKRDAMSFLAPGALTIAHGEEWARLRAFHDRVFAFEAGHPHAQVFHDRVRSAFGDPLRSIEDVRTAMGRAMLGIVLGGGAGSAEELPADVHALFGAVQSPVRRRLRGGSYGKMREQVYATLAARWRQTGPDDASLLGLARRHWRENGAPDEAGGGTGAADPPRVLLEQLPHWMFTFTGSGTDLLARTLAMIASRATVHARVREELASAGPPDRAETVWALRLVRGCLLETGRLFPPVTRTFHRSEGDAGVELVHYFPLIHRDDALGSSVHDFRPDRWLGGAPDPAAAAAITFLRGPRACPGRELILFVCASALARQLGEGGVDVRDTRLTRDPLPVSFPSHELRFQPRRRT